MDGRSRSCLERRRGPLPPRACRRAASTVVAGGQAFPVPLLSIAAPAARPARSSAAAATGRRGSALRVSPPVHPRELTAPMDRFSGNSTSPGVARPGVLSLNIREKAALYAAYMPFLKGGGI